MSERRSLLFGVMGEFSTPEDLLAATKKSREAGYKHIEAYTPFPIEGLSDAVGFRGFRSNLVALLTLMGGVGGGLTGFGLQYWVAGIYSGDIRIDGAGCFDFRGVRHAGAEQAAAAVSSGVQRGAVQPGVDGQILFVHRGARPEIRPGGNFEIPAEHARAARQRGEG